MKDIILATFRDLMVDVLYYDREEDEELEVGDIEKAVIEDESIIEEILFIVKEEILKSCDRKFQE